MFSQVTRSNGGTFALLFLFLLNQLVGCLGAYVTAGRQLWTLARDDVTPFSSWLSRVDAVHRNPFRAQIVCGGFVTCLGAIYIGNAQAFSAIIGSSNILTSWSFVAAILPHLLSGRRTLRPGVFWMPAWIAYPTSGLACAYILIFNVLYMFPYVYPPTVEGMNYACVMTVGSTLLLTAWYFWKTRFDGYEGPKVALDGRDDVLKGVVGLSKAEERAMRTATVAML